MEVALGTPQTGSHPTQLNTIGFRAFPVSFSFAVVLTAPKLPPAPKLLPVPKLLPAPKLFPSWREDNGDRSA